MLPVLRPTRLLLPLAAFCYGAAAAQSPAAGSLFINELVASNQTGTEDEAGQTEDWIELYNATGAAISLAGFTISDDPERPDKWPFPETAAVPARGFLVIWADEDQEDGPLHTNFKLSRGGESVALFDANGAQVDAVTFPELAEDEAYARRPDGSSDFVRQAPTFGGRNDGSSAIGSPVAYREFRTWPSTFIGADPAVTTFVPEGVRVIVLSDALGRRLWSVNVDPGTTAGARQLSLPALAPGAYYLRASGPLGSHTVDLLAQEGSGRRAGFE